MNLNRGYRYAIILLAAVSLFLPALAMAETADFDTLEEGRVGEELTDGGITFSDLDTGIDIITSVLAIEDAEGELSAPNFSPPNGLTASSHSLPPDNGDTGFGFGPIRSLSMTTGTDADSASMDVYTIGPVGNGNTVTLEALKNGQVVDSDSVAISDVEGNHFTLAIVESDFDTLRLVSAPDPQALMLDNVTINSSGPGPVTECKCDINQDGTCDMMDYNIFREDWGRDDCLNSSNICECDLEQDGTCDMMDYNIFIDDWYNEACQ